MKRLLIVKLSSLGDVIQSLPVLHDIKRYRPDLTVDWAVEEAYRELLQNHPNLFEAHAVGLRRWRRQGFLKPQSRFELRALNTKLSQANYAFALDLQGLFKSAVVARMSGAAIAGLSMSCARESLASLLYHHRFTLENCPAPVRCRILAAKAMGYENQAGFDPYSKDSDAFGLRQSLLAQDRKAQALMLIHISARKDKLWPESHWIGLGQKLASLGKKLRLPWGNDDERERAKRLAAAIPGAEVMQQLSLAALSRELSASQGAFGLDTGLSYLAIAAGIPTVRIYCGVDRGNTAGFDWINSRSVLGEAQLPTVAEVWQAWGSLSSSGA